MGSSTKIKRYRIENEDNILEMISGYFNLKRWKQVKKDNDIIYKTRYASTFFYIHKSEEELIIDVWIEGAFGVIVPYKNSIIGLIDKFGFQNILDEFEKYLDKNEIGFIHDITEKEGVTQTNYLLVMIVGSIVIGMSLFFILR